MAKLIGMSGDFQNREYPLDSDEITIGRKADNVILLDNPTISSHHCRIVRADGTYTLEDLGSTNGTRVNSRDVKSATLNPKDLLQIGSLEFMFEAPELGTTTGRYTDAEVEIATETMSAPESFANISPFGARPKSKLGTWYFVLILVGAVTLAMLLFFLVTLYS
jgi:predicted component of type VI protein secretion system